MTPERPDVSIVVVSWNSKKYLRDCLRSIQNNVSLRVEVIVVDNASTDGSAEMVQLDFPETVLIANNINRGFAAANNQGIEKSRGTYLLILNPDTEVHRRTIEESVAYMDSNKDIGIMGCKVMEDEEKIQKTCFSYPGPLNIFLAESGLHRAFPQSHFFGRPEISWWDRNSEQDVDVVSGMYMLVRRDLLQAIGMMDEEYFVYAEEADWCFRAQKAGWRCVFAPVGTIVHRDGGGKSTVQIKSRMYIQLQKSTLMFNRKNFGLWAYLIVRGIYVCSMLMRWCLWSGLDRVRPSVQASASRDLAASALAYHVLGREPKG